MNKLVIALWVVVVCFAQPSIAEVLSHQKPAFARDVYGNHPDDWGPANVVNGIIGAHAGEKWVSAGSVPSWWYVDLGNLYQIETIEVFAANAPGSEEGAHLNPIEYQVFGNDTALGAERMPATWQLVGTYSLPMGQPYGNDVSVFSVEGVFRVIGLWITDPGNDSIVRLPAVKVRGNPEPVQSVPALSPTPTTPPIAPATIAPDSQPPQILTHPTLTTQARAQTDTSHQARFRSGTQLQTHGAVQAHDQGSGLHLSRVQYQLSDDGGNQWHPPVGRSVLYCHGISTSHEAYWFPDIAHPEGFVTQPGDTLHYEIFLINEQTQAALDIAFDTYGYSLREMDTRDQFGVLAHPAHQDYHDFSGNWWHRIISLPEYVCFGYGINAIQVGFFGGTGPVGCYLRNIRIVGADGIKRLMIFGDDPKYQFPVETFGPGNRGYTDTKLEVIADPTLTWTGADGSLEPETITASSLPWTSTDNTPALRFLIFDRFGLESVSQPALFPETEHNGIVLPPTKPIYRKTPNPLGFFGMNMYPYSSASGIRHPESYYDDLVAMGVDWNRFHFMALPDTNTMDWQPLDWAVEQHSLRGIHILGIINHESCLVPHEHASSAYQTAFVERFTEITTRYKDTISWYEVWNEPDFQSGAYLSPEHYGALLSDVYQQVKLAPDAAHPDAMLLIQISNPWFGRRGGTEYLQQVYQSPAVQEFFAQHGFYPWDDVSIHIYQWTRSLSDNTSNHPLLQSADNIIFHGVKSVMNAHGDDHKKIWVTEFGWNTQPHGADSMGPDYTTNLRNQAAWLEDAYQLLIGTPDPARRALGPAIRNLFFYCHQEPQFGLRTSPISMRPAFEAYQNIASVTAEVLYMTRVDLYNTSFNGTGLSAGVDRFNDTYATDSGNHGHTFRAANPEPLTLPGPIRRVLIGCEASTELLPTKNVGVTLRPWFGPIPGRVSPVFQTETIDQLFWFDITHDFRAPPSWDSYAIETLAIEVAIHRPLGSPDVGLFFVDDVFVKIITSRQ